MNRTLATVAIAAIGALIIWLLWNRGSDAAEESGKESQAAAIRSAGLADPQPGKRPDSSSKSGRVPKPVPARKITGADVEAWVEMPQEEWLAQFDAKVPDAGKELRSDFATLLGEFQELRRRRGAALTPEDPAYRARRDGIVDFFESRYSGKTALTPEQIEARRKLVGIVGIKVKHSGDGVRKLLLDVVPGLPADHSGIEAGDELIAINGQDVVELASQEISSSLFGAPGEKVTLRVRRSATGEETVHELERVDADEVLPGNNVVR